MIDDKKPENVVNDDGLTYLDFAKAAAFFTIVASFALATNEIEDGLLLLAGYLLGSFTFSALIRAYKEGEIEEL